MAWLHRSVLIASFLFASACGNATTTITRGASTTVSGPSNNALGQPALTATSIHHDERTAVSPEAEYYATTVGVTSAEAERRFQLQDSIGALQQTLMEREAAFFGGLWIEHTPQYRVVVQMTEGGYDKVAPYIEGSPLADVVEVRQAAVTLRELEAAQAETIRILDQANVTAPSQLTVQKNRVEVFVYEREEFQGKLQQANVQLPPLVDLVVDDSSRPVTAEDTATPISESTSSAVQFFKQTPTDGPRAYPAAELRGTLIVAAGCLRVENTRNDYSVVPIWPVDYTMVEDNGVVMIRDGAGREVGRVDQEIYLGGGEIAVEAWSDYSGLHFSGLPPKPSTCPGPYWLVSPL